MIVLPYLLRMVLVSGILFGFYVLFQQNKPYHRYNRWFLLSIPVIALLLPLVKLPFPIPFNPGTGHPANLIRLLTVPSWEQEDIPGNGAAHRGMQWNWQWGGWIFYIVMTGSLAILFLRSLARIHRLSRQYPAESRNGVWVFQTEEPGTPFSFFKQIFWDRRLDINSKKGSQIFRHELAHVRQKHSLDSLFLEILRILYWFNPFFHLIRQESKAIHEFLADAAAADDTDKHEYAEMLVWQTFLKNNCTLSHPFFNNHLKRRIQMITVKDLTASKRLARLFILPLFLAMAYLFNAGFMPKDPDHSPNQSGHLIVVIDAGHGGTDNGYDAGQGIKEKDIALSIAEKVKELSKDYPIQVLLTRESDILPGQASSVREGLKNRTEFANSKKAYLFISIHANCDSSGFMNGFDMYISKNNERFLKESAALGSSLTRELKNTYTVADEVKQRAGSGIWVLDHSAMPSVLIECGYLTNEKDREFITNENNQRKVARDILLGILSYQAGRANSPH